MGPRTIKSVKLMVPEGTSRDQLLTFARGLLKQQLKVPHFEILEMSASDAKTAKSGEVTYKIQYVNLYPN